MLSSIIYHKGVMSTNVSKIIEKKSEELSNNSHEYLNKRSCSLPSVDVISRIVSLTAESIFPGYLGKSIRTNELLKSHLAINLEEIYALLCDQVERALRFEGDLPCTPSEVSAQQIALQFIESIGDIKSLLLTDVEAMYTADPAATNHGEVIFCYPSIVAMTHHRIAHKLYKLGVPIIPRIISEIAHSKTGIDIHPAATIADHFAIDHGTGVVIGETAIIGRHVVLYQGVTLGAKGFRYDENGNILNIARHPIIGDNVKIYSNSSILGRITIGNNSVIGGNMWIDYDVEPHSKIAMKR